MAKDINKKPYDKATLTKLDIFEQYLLAWLPVFIHTRSATNIKICDYCAGSGQDSEEVAGSPLRILRTIEKYRDSILQKSFSIDVILNEANSGKSNELQNAVNSCFNSSSWNSRVNVCCHNEAFHDLFCKHYEQLKQQPNLLFVDQYGIKEVTGEIFQMLIDLQQTDFLFFMSSSLMKRFANTPEFQTHFPDIDLDMISNAKYEDIHRNMLDYYKGKIPAGNTTKLYPFTLKKDRNIYGLVFGSKHPLGVEKFLKLAWNKNKINGEANFDIDKDVQRSQPTLFDSQPEYEKHKTKHEVFEIDLENFIQLNGEVDNRRIYFFTLSQGHPASHARECVRRLKKENKVECKGNIGFSYNSCVKDNPILKKVKYNG
jgi:three-Cys-motif partner protein